MRMKKCQKCGEYTLKDKHCQEKTKQAGYKYVRVKKGSLINQSTMEDSAS